MSKIQAMRDSLSLAALDALGHIGSDKIGFVVQVRDPKVMTELRKVGVVGVRDGLTVIGSTVAAQRREEVMNAYF